MVNTRHQSNQTTQPSTSQSTSEGERAASVAPAGDSTTNMNLSDGDIAKLIAAITRQAGNMNVMPLAVPSTSSHGATSISSTDGMANTPPTTTATVVGDIDGERIMKIVSRLQTNSSMGNFSGDIEGTDGRIALSLQEFENVLHFQTYGLNDHQLFLVARQFLDGCAADVLQDATLRTSATWTNLKRLLEEKFPTMVNVTDQIYSLKRKPGQSAKDFIYMVKNKIRILPEGEQNIHLKRIIDSTLPKPISLYWNAICNLPMAERIRNLEQQIEINPTWGMTTAHLTAEREGGVVSNSTLGQMYQPPKVAAAAAAAATTVPDYAPQ